MTEKTYFVAAKNLTTRKMSVYDHRSFYVMHDNGTYSRFHPKDVTDFKGKKVSSALKTVRTSKLVKDNEAGPSSKSSSKAIVTSDEEGENDAEFLEALSQGGLESPKEKQQGGSDNELFELKPNGGSDTDIEPSKNVLNAKVASSSSDSVEKIVNPLLEGLKSELASVLKDQLAQQLATKQGATDEENKATEVLIPLPGNLPVPKGQIHIGDNALVNLKDVHAEVELKTFELRKRVRYLLQLFFPEDYSQRSLDPNKVTKVSGTCLPISKAQVAIMSDLLDKMGWLKGAKSDCSPQNISLLIRKETQRFRAAANLNAKPEHERQQIIEQLRARAKELRDQASVKRKAEKKTEDAKKKKVNHEDQEGVSEESSDST